MTATLTVLYTTPDDASAFDAHYRDVHVPIIRKWANFTRAELTWINTTIGPVTYHLMAQITFPTRADLDAALASEAGAEAGADFGAIAPPGSFMMIGETETAS